MARHASSRFVYLFFLIFSEYNIMILIFILILTVKEIRTSGLDQITAEQMEGFRKEAEIMVYVLQPYFLPLSSPLSPPSLSPPSLSPPSLSPPSLSPPS